jgi:NAD-dependent SIR2 family protein deacetylase
MRIPYTQPLPPPLIIPASAATRQGAITSLARFLNPPISSSASSSSSRLSDNVNGHETEKTNKTVLLTGAGISVASGLADYRGPNGTYTQNKSYRPIYYHEFVASHESRKRYWARSFLGWRGLHRSSPNATHYAIRDLGRLGVVDTVITQNVDSFHPLAHPSLPQTIELHGFLRSLVCLSCKQLMDRDTFQTRLAELNPAWAVFLQELLASGALDTEDPLERRKRGFRTNPDGDADVPDAPYTTFRYPACPSCLRRPPILSDGSKGHVDVDKDGAWIPSRPPSSSSSSSTSASTSTPSSGVGVLKPNVIMFGESIPTPIKAAAEAAIDSASRILVVGSSLATYSAWRLVKRAHERGMGIGILNMGGVRKEEIFFGEYHPHHHPDRSQGGGAEVEAEAEAEADDHKGLSAMRRAVVRASLPAEEILPAVVERIRQEERNKAER